MRLPPIPPRLVLGPAPHERTPFDPRVHKPTIHETRMTRVVNGVRHTTLSDAMSNNVNPCGVFFTLFLRSFILLRELENVGPPRLGP